MKVAVGDQFSVLYQTSDQEIQVNLKTRFIFLEEVAVTFPWQTTQIVSLEKVADLTSQNTERADVIR
ncbi:Hypothetical predicted protein [Octopus vulgaris]|uniref:Uncharacterized protein n=1 Tax=Octopus vulgaris TaxID=6645 RepID=A0AA36F7W9_OCTVU|nr:Hypothetical predicted protein [Octopus vulgaris]